MPSTFLLPFVPLGPPRGLARLVAVHAVVAPLCGVHRFEAVPAAASALVVRWRACVRRLARRGWARAKC